jgi:hypothetical protein
MGPVSSHPANMTQACSACNSVLYNLSLEARTTCMMASDVATAAGQACSARRACPHCSRGRFKFATLCRVSRAQLKKCRGRAPRAGPSPFARPFAIGT